MDTGRKIYLFFAALVFVVFLVVIARFYYLQVFKHEERMYKIENSFDYKVVSGRRGTIYDKDGNPLAMSEYKVDLAIDPAGVKDKEFMADIISSNVGIDRQKVLEILKQDKKKSGKPNHYALLKKDAKHDEIKILKNAVKEAGSIESQKLRKIKIEDDDSDAEKARKNKERSLLERHIKDLNLIIYEEGFKRVYPQGKLLANVLGFVQANKKADEKNEKGVETKEGLDGIELKYDEDLAGKKVWLKQNRLTKKIVYDDDIDIESELGDSRRGKDIYLTIDSEIQFIAGNPGEWPKPEGAEEDLRVMHERLKMI